MNTCGVCLLHSTPSAAYALDHDMRYQHHSSSTTHAVALQAGVALASAGELSFNWLGFSTAMASNLTFGFRAVWSKMWVARAQRDAVCMCMDELVTVLVAV
jgi:hypothetical protein